MYVIPTLPITLLQQGDVIEYKFPNIRSAKLLSSVQDGQYEIATTESSANFKLEELEVRNVMLVSQTCDISRRENILVCPIYKLSEFTEQSAINADTLRNLKNNKLYYWFYLPQLPGYIDESFVDLQQITPVERTSIEARMQNVIVSLNDLGRHQVGWSLASFFGRPVNS